MASPRSTQISLDSVQTFFKTWHVAEADTSHFHTLCAVQNLTSTVDSQSAAVRQFFEQAIEQLAAINPDAAALLRLKFVEKRTNHTVSQRLNVAEATFYRRQAQALDEFTSLLSALEHEALAQRREQLLNRLERPSNRQLFGIDRAVNELAALLTGHLHQDDAVVVGDAPPPDLSDGTSTDGQKAGTIPWIVLIEGIGGIGKTALADALARHLLMHFATIEIGWVTARQRFLDMAGNLHAVATPALTPEALVAAIAEQILGPDRALLLSHEQRLTQLEQQLRQRHHLIIIDNLETVEDLEQLLPCLRQLTNPTQFVLTSRQSLYMYGDIYHFPLTELTWPDACALLRHEAEQRNLPQLLHASDAELSPIYTTVGGNPLALRLVAGQVHIHALDVILDDLHSARGAKAESLYHFIYWHAWEHLDEVARSTLLAMPVVMDEGGTLERIEAISGIDPAKLRPALEELVSRNLVNSTMHLHDRQYSIHSLTRTFLLQQVLQWQ